DLAALHPEPVLVGRRARRVLVDAGPLPRQRLDRVLGRAAAALGLLEQRLVVLLGGREAVRAHDRLAGIVRVAVAPGRGLRRIRSDRRRAAAAAGPEILDVGRAVAAEVARVAPELP